MITRQTGGVLLHNGGQEHVHDLAALFHKLVFDIPGIAGLDEQLVNLSFEVGVLAAHRRGLGQPHEQVPRRHGLLPLFPGHQPPESVLGPPQ